MRLSATLTLGVVTLKGFARDRIFHAALIFALLMTAFAFLISSLTILEERKILLDFGLSAISMSGVGMAIFLGLASIAREIENKTIYTVISKPIARWQYLFGRFLGCSAVLVITHLLLGLTLFFVVKQLGEGTPSGFLACNYLMLLESLLVLTAASLFSVSTSSTFLAGSLTFALFLIGRSANSFRVVAAKSDSSTAKFILRAFYDFFPSLDRFNIRDLVAYGKPYPAEILWHSTLYFFAYAVLFIALTNFLFAKKDLT